jgi:hypothetical protein
MTGNKTAGIPLTLIDDKDLVFAYRRKCHIFYMWGFFFVRRTYRPSCCS